MAAGVSLAVTAVALLGFVGVIPVDAGAGADPTRAATGRTSGSGADLAGATTDDAGSAAGADASRSQPDPTSRALSAVATPDASAAASSALPAASGSGRRVVFSKGAQRVWLVDSAGQVTSTYLVSGSVTNNLQPGRYDVYSRSRWAVGVDDSGVMQYFVRFAHGPRAAIGFHSIPTKNGVPLQTEAQLGSPQSHGCIRQKLSDAERMWQFADVGTDVVVVA